MTPEQKAKVNDYLDAAIAFQEEFLNYYPEGSPEHTNALNEIKILRSQKL
jgi:hypothetical protein